MSNNLPKIKPSRTGGLAGYPKAAGAAFKVGNIAYFEKAPDARWLPCDGSSIAATAYPELTRVLATPKAPLLQQLPVSGTIPISSPNAGRSTVLTGDGLYLAALKDNTTAPQIYLYQNINDTYIYQNATSIVTPAGIAIVEMAWSPDGTRLAVIFNGVNAIYIFNRAGNVLTAGSNASNASLQSNLTWIDNDLFVTIQTSSNNIVVWTVSGGGVPAFSATIASTTVSQLQVTAGKLLVAMSISNVYIYQRNGGSLTQINTFASVGINQGGAVTQIGVLGEADIIFLLATSGYLGIYTKNQITGAYTYTKQIVYFPANTRYELFVDANKDYLYQIGSNSAGNQTTTVYSMANSVFMPEYTEADIVFTGSALSCAGAAITSNGKYILWFSTTSPYFAVFKELPTSKVVLPLSTARYKLGRKVYPFIKAKS